MSLITVLDLLRDDSDFIKGGLVAWTQGGLTIKWLYCQFKRKLKTWKNYVGALPSFPQHLSGNPRAVFFSWTSTRPSTEISAGDKQQRLSNNPKIARRVSLLRRRAWKSRDWTFCFNCRCQNESVSSFPVFSNWPVTRVIVILITQIIYKGLVQFTIIVSLLSLWDVVLMSLKKTLISPDNRNFSLEDFAALEREICSN